MTDKKYHVFFRRVSTAAQDLSMQESADAPFREKLLPEEIMIVDEDAVSANKLSIHNRPEMQKVISLIKQDKVHTLYALIVLAYSETFTRVWSSQIYVSNMVFKSSIHLKEMEISKQRMTFFLKEFSVCTAILKGKTLREGRQRLEECILLKS